jgi:6-phosphogluconolactonase
LARSGADRFITLARAATTERGVFNVALAGGSTPKAMFTLLTAEPLRAKVDWNSVRFFFGDERCVPPDNADSNYGMARKNLFDPLGIPPDHVHRMRGEAPPQEAAREYETMLVQTLGDPPVLDLVMLGMGPEGHTASLFPGTFAQFDPSRFVVTTYIEKLSTNRITFTPRTINAARAILLMTGGEAKAEALAEVLAGARNPDLYPAQILDPQHGSLTWLVDRAATKGLGS